MEVLNFHGGDEFFPCAPFRVGSRQHKTVPSLRQKARRIRRYARALKENESRPLVDLKGFDPYLIGYEPIALTVTPQVSIGAGNRI